MVEVIKLNDEEKILNHDGHFFTGPNTIEALRKYRDMGVKVLISIYPYSFSQSGFVDKFDPSLRHLGQSLSRFCKRNNMIVIFENSFSRNHASPKEREQLVAGIALKFTAANVKVAVCCRRGDSSGTYNKNAYFALKRKMQEAPIVTHQKPRAVRLRRKK